ncbi:hypothetical protein [Methylocystis bryophila]|nr:hypothetical protein [Methylocystis bryophila]
MNRIHGRNIFIVSLAGVLQPIGPGLFLERATASRFSALWIRVGRGEGMDPNLAMPELDGLRRSLKDADVDLWGWHVSFCATPSAARKEADLALEWVERHELDGLVLDLEKTPDTPRFQGGPREAEIYAGRLAEGLAAKGRGIALSTHDQPSLHPDAPLETALGIVEDVTPQVYYRSAAVARRFKKSLREYEALIGKDAIRRRYKPTGNITTSANLPLHSPAASLAATRSFLHLVRKTGCDAYSFWCWDAAPREIWDFLRHEPV